MQEIRENVPLAPMTTFGIGGSARYLVDVRKEADIREAMQWARERGVRFVVLGGGSNVLVPDQGLNALVIRLVGNLYGARGGEVDAWAGTNLFTLMRSAGAQGYGGWESIAGIPGTVGGATRGNAGAFGQEIKDFVITVQALNAQTGDTKLFSNAECDFSYRHSFFKDHPEWIITRTHVRLVQRERGDIAKAIEATVAEREKRHLQNVCAAGSFFMNPVAPRKVQEMFEREKGVPARLGRVPAGWLIEKAGMKGATIGGAIASLQHPNYIVNQGGATAADVARLAEQIRSTVKSKFGVTLEEEAAVL